MSENPQATATSAQANSTSMRAEIEQTWGRFDAKEIAGLKNKDDLVAQVQSKYQLDRAQAQKQVDAFAKGRQL